MTPERHELMAWLSTLAGRAGEWTEKDRTIYEEIKRVLKLSPDNLTWTAGHLMEQIHYADTDKFTPIYIEVQDILCSIRYVRRDNLDNLFDGQDGDADVIVLEAEPL
jgi:hypothetical protein